MTRIEIPVGRTNWGLQARTEDLIVPRRAVEPTPLADPRSAVRNALEHPVRFEPLRRALTPDDRVAVVVDESLPQLPALLEPVLEHLTSAGVAPDRVTLVTADAGTGQHWLDALPEAFEDVRTEVHDPDNRQRMSYLATTRQGRRLYLNRTLVDADQLVVLSGRGYDPLLGYSGCEGSIFPAFADAESRHAYSGRLSTAAPGADAWPVRQEAQEVAWLMGAPFVVQAIEGFGDDVAYVCAGLIDTTEDGRRALEDRWHVRVDRPAATVVTSISGDPNRHGFGDLARALACAARVVEPGGCIVVLSEIEAQAGEAGELLRTAEEPAEALRRVAERKTEAMAAAFEWASAAAQARVYIGCDLPPDVIEEWFATPITSPQQVQRLLDAPGTCLFLPDGHKTLATVGPG